MARKTLLGLLGLLGCGAAPPSALVVAPNAALPAELIGEFACHSQGFRAHLTLRADGRFKETDRSMLRDGRWQSLAPAEPPCDPWGWARFDAASATLTLEEQSATCEELGDPITIPRARRVLNLRQVDAHGFHADEETCERVGYGASPSGAFPL